MAVSRDIEKLKKKAREAVQKEQQEKKSSYTFTPKVGSANNSFSDIPKQEAPKETKKEYVKVEAPQRTFTPSTVMGNSFSSLPKTKKTFTPSTVIGGTRENTFGNIPVYAQQRQIAQTPRLTSNASLSRLRATNGTVSAATGQELSRFFNTYNAVIRANMSARQKRATLQRMIGNNSDLFKRYENETGKKFDIAALGSEYGDINRRQDQERRDSFFARKLQDYESIIPQSGTFYGDYIRRNGEYDRKYASLSAGRLDDFLEKYKDYRKAKIENPRMTAFDSTIQKVEHINPNVLYITDDERDIYATLLNERGQAAADDYLDRLSNRLDQRRAEILSAYESDKANKHKILGTIDNTINLSLAKGKGLPELAKQSFKQANSSYDTYRPFNPYSSGFDVSTQSRAIREGITRDMSNLGKTVTDFTLGLGENAARIPLGPAGLYIMGAGVAADTAVNQGLKGETNASNAFLTGVAYGAVEVATEKISLDSLMSIMRAPKDEAVTGIKAILKSIAKNAPKQAGYEASEEALSSIADNIADRIINGDKSEYEEYVRELMRNGASESKARKAAFVDKYIIDTLKDASAGAASGAIFGTGGSAINGAAQVYDNTTTIGRGLKDLGAGQSVVETGLARDAQTGANKYAQRMQNKQGKGRDLSDWNVGRQFVKNVQSDGSTDSFVNAMSKFTPITEHDRLTDTINGEEREINGRLNQDSTIDTSLNSDMSREATVKHEILHWLKQNAPEAYNTLENTVMTAARETNSEAVDSRMQYLMSEYGYDEPTAKEEIVAELTGGFNNRAIQRIAEGNNTLADKIATGLRRAKAQIKQAYSKGNYTNAQGLQLTFEQLNNAEKAYIQGLEQARGNTAENGEVRYSFDKTNPDIRFSVKEGNEYTPNKVARRLIDEYGAKGNVYVKDIQDDIRALSEKVSGVFSDSANIETNYAAFEAEARAVAEKIADSARVINNEKRDEYNDLRKFIKNRRVRITDELRSDIPDFNSFRQSLFGLVTFSKDGEGIDSLYKDLQDRFPQYFDETKETTQSDQLEQLEKTLRGLQDNETEVSDADYDAMIEELTGRIVSDAINIGGTTATNADTSKPKERFTPNADINKIVNSDMTDAEKRRALEDRAHFIPRGGRDLYAEAQQKGKEHFDKMHKVKPSEYSEDDWKSYGEDFGTDNMRQDMQQRAEEAERRDREAFNERFDRAFPNSQYSEEDWDNLSEPVSDNYDWTKDGRNWSEPQEKPKTAAELDAEADETTRTLMEEKGVDSPDQLAEETVSREDTKKRNRQFYRTKEGIQTLGSRLYTDIVDDMHPFWNYNDSFEKTQTRLENGKKVTAHTYGKENPYKMAMNAKDASSRSAYLVTDYLTDFDGNVLGKGLIDTLAEGGISKEDYKAFNEYLVANHALEWLDEKSGGKYKKVYEDDRLNNWRVVKKMVDAFEKNHPNFKQAAENIYDWQRKLLKAWLVDTGVITQDQYNYLTETYPHYVPFYRETDIAAAGGNTGLANLTDPIKKAQGGNKRILNPIENIMYNTASYVNHASKHAVTKAAVDMYDILESDPENNILRAYWEEVFPRNPQDFNPTTFVKKGQTEGEILDATEEAPEMSISDTLRSQVGIKDGVVRINDNGTMRYFQVYDKDFLNVLDNVRKGREGLLAAAAAVSRARAALLTSFKPQFALVTNPIRDFGTYLVNSSDVNKAKAIGAAASSYVDIVKKSEAYRQYKAMGGEYSSFTTEGKNELKKALQKLSNENPNIAKKFFKGVTGVFGAYENLGNAIETAPRLGEFKRTLDQGYDIHEAFYRAKDVTVNFSRGGGWPIMKYFNIASNFFNAAIQGSDKFFRQAKNNPTSMAVGMAGLAMISLLKYGLDNLFKDDKYEEASKDLSNYQKNSNWNFYVGNGRFISIPKPRENAVLITAGEAAVDKFMDEQDDRFKGFFTDYVLGTYFPDGSIVGVSDYIALSTNKDYRGVPIVSKELQDLPKELQFDDNTSYFAKWLGEVTKQSPKQIDYVLNNNLGVGGTFNKTYFTPNSKKDPAAMWSFGLSNTFLKDAYYSTDMTNMFYTNKDKAEKQSNGYPNADNDYLNSRYSQAGNVMGIINQMVKAHADDKTKSLYDLETNRWFKRAYTNYAAEYKDNPMGLSDEVYKEIKGLYDEDSSILELPKIYGELKANKQSYTFDDPYKVIQYQKDVNNAVDKAYRDVIATAEYQVMDNADKAEALKKAKTDAADAVKEMYVSGKVENAPKTSGAVAKPTQEAVKAAQAKKDRKADITTDYVQKISDDFAAANPGKDGYSVDTMMKIEPTKVKVGGKEYEVSGETANKIAAAAEDKFYDNIESFYSGEVPVEYLIGKNADGKAKYSENAAGKRVYLTGGRYNADGSNRFDKTIEGKIIFRLKDAAIDAAAEEYADEITGDTSSIADATPSPQGEGLKVSYRSSSSSRKSGGRRSSGRSSGGGRSGRKGKTISLSDFQTAFKANDSLYGTLGRKGGSNISSSSTQARFTPSLARAIRPKKIEAIKPIRMI